MPAAHTPHSPFAQSPHLDPRTPLCPPPGPLRGLPTPGVPAGGQMEPWGPSSPPFSLLGWARRDYPLGSTPSAACRRQREVTGASLLRSSPSVPLVAAPRPAEVTGEVLPASPPTACGHVSVLGPARRWTSARKSMSCWTVSDPPPTRTAWGTSNRSPSFTCHRHHQRPQDLALCPPSSWEARWEARAQTGLLPVQPWDCHQNRE